MLNDVHRSTLWSAIQQVLVLSVQFGVGVVLARLLNPYDYGVVAMQAVFFSIAHVFVECGFEGVLIQKGDAEETMRTHHSCALLLLVSCCIPCCFMLRH